MSFIVNKVQYLWVNREDESQTFVQVMARMLSNGETVNIKGYRDEKCIEVKVNT